MSGFSERSAGSFDFGSLFSNAPSAVQSWVGSVQNKVDAGIAAGNARMYVNSVDPYSYSLNPRVRAKAENNDNNIDPSLSYGASAAPDPLVYYDAPFAEKYGMDASTAYQEALANTAYQRKVADLKAAGLNPVLGVAGSGAASFYGNEAGSISAGSSGSGKTSSGFDWASAAPYFAGLALDLALNFVPSRGAAHAGQIAGQTVMKGFGNSSARSFLMNAIKAGLR